MAKAVKCVAPTIEVLWSDVGQPSVTLVFTWPDGDTYKYVLPSTEARVLRDELDLAIDNAEE